MTFRLALAAALFLSQPDHIRGQSMDQCTFQPYVSAVSSSGARKIWMSLFSAVSADNPSRSCSLGPTGFTMSSILVSETGASCHKSDMLALFGKSYYRLELSPDGKVIKRFNAGCSDPGCSSCEYDRTKLSMRQCLSTPTSSGHVFSVAFAEHKDGACVGPYKVSNSTGITALESLMPRDGTCPDTQNCTVALFAVTITDQADVCHPIAPLFSKESRHSYSLTSISDNETFSYTMVLCNGTVCGRDGGRCDSLFTSLPLDKCVMNTWNEVEGSVMLIGNNHLATCSSPKKSKTFWIAAVSVGGALLVILIVFGVIKARKSKRRGYTQLN